MPKNSRSIFLFPIEGVQPLDLGIDVLAVALYRMEGPSTLHFVKKLSLEIPSDACLVIFP